VSAVFALATSAFALATSSCAMRIDVPAVPPSEGWNPSLNTHPDSAVFQALLDRYVRDGLPGVVLLVRTPQGQWNGAAGFAKIETGQPLLPDARFYGASVTKMYTAAAVMLLAEDGLVDLDARIGEYLPDEISGEVPNGTGATVRELLGHTSGIPDFSGAVTYELETLNDPLGSYPPDRMLGYIKGQSPIFPPGTGYFYSNANYLLLGMIAERVTGSSLPEVIDGRILRPLGLRATYFGSGSSEAALPGIVNTYDDLAGDGRLMNVSDLTAHSAAESMGYSGVIATSADCADFIEALQDGRVVTQASLAQMEASTKSPTHGLGLGLDLMQTPYGTAVGHSGGDVGALSQVRRFPDLGATLVLLVNGGEGGVLSRLFRSLWNDAMEAALGDLQETP
jgi:D-alanyl-D-alanine carboxypeptidase